MDDSNLSYAYLDGERLKTDQGEIALTVVDAGTLLLPSGRLLACDPLFGLGADSYSRHFRPGEYAVHLSLAQFPDGGGCWISFARIQFGNRMARRWVATALPDEETSRFTVDSGTACVLDRRTARLLLRNLERNPDFLERTQPSLSGSDGDYSWTNVVVDPSSGANVIAFSSGAGDGVFACYYRFDGRGRLADFVIDFDMLSGHPRSE
jgi:hypothetical protein